MFHWFSCVEWLLLAMLAVSSLDALLSVCRIHACSGAAEDVAGSHNDDTAHLWGVTCVIPYCGWQLWRSDVSVLKS